MRYSTDQQALTNSCQQMRRSLADLADVATAVQQLAVTLRGAAHYDGGAVEAAGRGLHGRREALDHYITLVEYWQSILDNAISMSTWRGAGMTLSDAANSVLGDKVATASVLDFKPMARTADQTVLGTDSGAAQTISPTDAANQLYTALHTKTLTDAGRRNAVLAILNSLSPANVPAFINEYQRISGNHSLLSGIPNPDPLHDIYRYEPDPATCYQAALVLDPYSIYPEFQPDDQTHQYGPIQIHPVYPIVATTVPISFSINPELMADPPPQPYTIRAFIQNPDGTTTPYYGRQTSLQTGTSHIVFVVRSFDPNNPAINTTRFYTVDQQAMSPQQSAQDALKNTPPPLPPEKLRQQYEDQITYLNGKIAEALAARNAPAIQASTVDSDTLQTDPVIGPALLQIRALHAAIANVDQLNGTFLTPIPAVLTDPHTGQPTVLQLYGMQVDGQWRVVDMTNPLNPSHFNGDGGTLQSAWQDYLDHNRDGAGVVTITPMPSIYILKNPDSVALPRTTYVSSGNSALSNGTDGLNWASFIFGTAGIALLLVVQPELAPLVGSSGIETLINIVGVVSGGAGLLSSVYTIGDQINHGDFQFNVQTALTVIGAAYSIVGLGPLADVSLPKTLNKVIAVTGPAEGLASIVVGSASYPTISLTKDQLTQLATLENKLKAGNLSLPQVQQIKAQIQQILDNAKTMPGK